MLRRCPSRTCTCTGPTVVIAGVTGPQGPTGPTGAQGPVGALPDGSVPSQYLSWNGSSWVSQGISVRLGNNAGGTAQGTAAVAIGTEAGRNNQKSTSIAVGLQAGRDNQGVNAVAVGAYAGAYATLASKGQAYNAVAVGSYAGNIDQLESAVAVGGSAGSISQGFAAVAVGRFAGGTNQAENAIAIGNEAALFEQQANAVAIGTSAGGQYQGAGSVCIGLKTAAGAGAIVIGSATDGTTGAPNSIVLNATGSSLATTTSSLVIAPVRAAAAATSSLLQYDALTKEITTFPAPSFARAGLNNNFLLNNVAFTALGVAATIPSKPPTSVAAVTVTAFVTSPAPVHVYVSFQIVNGATVHVDAANDNALILRADGDAAASATLTHQLPGSVTYPCTVVPWARVGQLGDVCTLNSVQLLVHLL